jgi:HK97 gp10 family phage protein
MAEQFIHVKGLAELQAFLDQLPEKMAQNVMRGALRAGMNQVKPRAQANVHSVSGQLARGLKVSTVRKGSMVIARLRATGRHGFVAHMLEFTGAAPHYIFARAGGAITFGGIFRRAVKHPGFKARPFMRPALDAQAGAAVVAAGEYIKRRLATKNGLDTADVEIELQ